MSAWPATSRTACGPHGTRAASSGAKTPASWSRSRPRACINGARWPWRSGTAQWRGPPPTSILSLPPTCASYNDFPMLQADAVDGRMWLFFRHRLLRFRERSQRYSRAPCRLGDLRRHATKASRGANRWPCLLSRAAWICAADSPPMAAATSGPPGPPTIAISKSSCSSTRRCICRRGCPLPAGTRAEPRLKARVEPRLHGALPRRTRTKPATCGASAATRSQRRQDLSHLSRRHPPPFGILHGRQQRRLAATRLIATPSTRRELDYLAQTEHNGDGGPDIPYINWLQQQMCGRDHAAGHLHAAVLLRAQRQSIPTAIAT